MGTGTEATQRNAVLVFTTGRRVVARLRQLPWHITYRDTDGRLIRFELVSINQGLQWVYREIAKP